MIISLSLVQNIHKTKHQKEGRFAPLASILIRTAIIYLFLSVIMKMTGKRQLGELEVEELISTFLISEIEFFPIEDPDIPVLNAIITILIIVCLEISISFFKNKSNLLKRVVGGEAVYIIYKGRLLQSALFKNRISIEELLSAARQNGVGSISDIRYAIIEPNGKISIVENGITKVLISDGEPNKKTLKSLGYNDAWLKKQLDAAGARLSDVFFFGIDDDGKTTLLRKEKEE